MFGLPPETLILLVGAPLAWIAYTIVFLVRSRNWGSESGDSTED